MTKDDIQAIVGKQIKHDLKKYILTAGNTIMESSSLEWDDFVECYGLNTPTGFAVVIIKDESNDISDLEFAIEC